MKGIRRIVALLVGSLFVGAWEVCAGENVFAVLTRKEGVASAFAHDHFVVAPDARFGVEGGGDAKHPMKDLSLSTDIAVANLVIDDPRLQSLWYPELKRLALLDAPFSTASASDRDVMRGEMMSAGQLDIDRFPIIRARITNFLPRRQTIGAVVFNYVARAEVTLRGKTVSKDVVVATSGAEPLTLKLHGTFHFSEFGIEPYAAYLGAVKIRDRFDVYVITEITFPTKN